jgi:uncharacterized protein (DUF2141 family)
MKQTVVVALTVLLATLGVAPRSPGAQPSVELIVGATGFEGSAGPAIAKLYRKGQDVLGKPYMMARAKVQKGKASMTFRGLKPGPYAVVVFQDENQNGQIDHNLLGMPSEPLGFSNGFKPGLLAGMPTFEKLRFELPKSAAIAIKMN